MSISNLSLFERSNGVYYIIYAQDERPRGNQLMQLSSVNVTDVYSHLAASELRNAVTEISLPLS